jgi:uncharacterized membrane protein YebE (DUF533 family)
MSQFVGDRKYYSVLQSQLNKNNSGQDEQKGADQDKSSDEKIEYSCLCSLIFIRKGSAKSEPNGEKGSNGSATKRS